MITQAEVIRAYGTPLVSDYPKYTAGTAMLETAERFTPVEKEPAIRQFLLLIGGLRALGDAVDPTETPPAAMTRRRGPDEPEALDRCRGPRRRPARHPADRSRGSAGQLARKTCRAIPAWSSTPTSSGR